MVRRWLLIGHFPNLYTPDAADGGTPTHDTQDGRGVRFAPLSDSVHASVNRGAVSALLMVSVGAVVMRS
jgi:hypothetical protein